MWKTTDRSINQRRMKALEAENKVSVLYIRNPESESKRSSQNNVASAPNTEREANNYDSNKKTGAVKRPQAESEENPLTNPTVENPTLKRRQVTEQLPKHTTPGENLRFIATPRYKRARADMITRKQWRHLSRRPWERRVKSKA